MERLKEKLHLGSSQPKATPEPALAGAVATTQSQSPKANLGVTETVTLHPQGPRKLAWTVEGSNVWPIRTRTLERLDEVQRDLWNLKSGSFEVLVRDLAEPVLCVVGWANDHITGAVSLNGFDSIAWFGVSLLLPVGC